MSGPISTWNALAALRARLLDAPGIPDRDHIQWHRRSYDPPEDAAWLRETFLVAGEQPTFQTRQLTGTYVLGSFYPLVPEDALKAQVQFADGLKLHFAPGTQGIEHGGQLVAIDRSELGADSRDPDGPWWMVPVIVYWRVTR